ncbi:MAG TPA: TPD domain-containing protein [Thermoplasmata archaeon]|nr:TPD domain-containing protein [Thermoplasmata archaeon]
MDRETYRRLSDALVNYADIQRIAEAEGRDPELLFVIYTHRVSRDATRRFYVVKRQVPRLAGQWRHGKSMLDIAREWKFPPVLMGQMLLQELKIPRKKVWGTFLNPESAPDARLRREVVHLLEHDQVYSPQGMELQRERGRRGEERLYGWLEQHGIAYRTEKDLRGKYTKTPDALLDHPIIFYGQKLKWIESKANFGDDVELRKNLRRQLGPYTELFGEGAVVYWYGYVDGADSPPGILLWDGPTIESITPTVQPPPASVPAASPLPGHARR